MNSSQNRRLDFRIESLETRIAPAFAAVLDIATLTGPNGFELRGENSLDYAGYSVSAAGDVNGDGFDDILVGAYGADPRENEAAGVAYVIFGRANDFNTPINLTTLNGVNGFRINGVAEGDYAGRAVAAAGDVNGDGFADVLVGAFGADPNGNYERGSAYIVYGKASGFAPEVELAALNGEDGFRINGEVAGDYAGFAVNGAGDVNGDGFDDFLIGAPNAGIDGKTYVGATYVVFGKARTTAAVLNLATLNGTNGFKIIGEELNDYAGSAVSAAGDVNGDGIGDIVIGAYAADRGTEAEAGAAYVVFGRSSGFAALLDLGTLNGANGFKVIGESAQDYAGTSVSSAGDVNGDGFDDILDGAANADANATSQTGAAYLLFGKAAGFTALVDLSTLNGVNGFQLQGTATGDLFGSSVSSAGDINADGFDEIIVGAPEGSDIGSGASYVVFGTDQPFPAAVDVTAFDGRTGFQIRGAAQGDLFGSAVSDLGDIDHDGFDDLLVGAPGAGIEGDARGAAYVIPGRSSVPEVHIGNGEAIEGDILTNAVAFEVHLDGPSTQPVLVTLAATGGTAAAGTDFLPPLSGLLVAFAPGEIAKTVNIEVIGDLSIETDETFFLQAIAATNATIAADLGVGTILNDDTAVRISDARAAEGDTGSAPLTFLLSLEQPSILPVSVNVTSADRTATAAVDYAPVATTIVFAPGETTRSVAVSLMGDAIVEDDESFALLLSGPVNAVIADGEAVGTIVNDETLVRVSGVTVAEGDNGPTEVLFPVTLSVAHREIVSVDYVVSPGSALAGSDYVAAASGTLLFAPGETSQTISVSIVGDVLPESDETFSITLTVATNASIDVPTATGLIQNDDGALQIQDASVLEGHAGTRSLSFPVSLAAPSILPITVDFTVVSGTASAGADYTALASGTLSFAPGETMQFINAEVFGDAIVESNETFSVVLANAANARIDDATALGTILNDDVTIRAPRRATFIDVDGDLVTVTTDKGSFAAENFVLVPAGSGFQLALVTIVGEGAFQGANLEISAERIGTGDGVVHVGAIDARGIGLAKVAVDGDLGQIDAGTVTGSAVLSIEARSLGAFGTATQLPGGATDSVITGTLGKLKLARDMSGATIAVSKNIRAVSIHGSLLDGAMRAGGQIGSVKIGGDIRGTAEDASEITALGNEAPASKKEALAMRALRIGGSLEHADILAGYDLSGVASNGAVRSGNVLLGGNWTASNVVAGAMAGDDGLFGTEDDALIPSDSAVVSRIALLQIKGEVAATPEDTDHFGIVAAQIAAARNGERTIALAPGAGNDINVRAGAADDVRIMEIDASV
jgi:hypothetical protein